MNHELQLLHEVYKTADKIALSTALNGDADVKIVNYVWLDEEPNKLYFSSVRGSHALAIYQESPDAALITVPRDSHTNNPFVRAHHVKIEQSTKTMAELLPRYLSLVDHYQRTWDAIGDTLVVYEITLDEVHVDAGLGQEKVDITL